MKKIAVIIVSYNVKRYVEQCLISLYRALDGIDAEIFVVDNHSKDNSVEFLRKRFNRVNFIRSIHNQGFARANNIAIRQSESQYVLLLNPDTFVAENTIRNALSFLDNTPKAGALGVRMLRTDGSNAMESRRGLPSPVVAFYKMTGLCNRFPNSKRFGHYYMGYLPWNEATQIEVISGAFMMIRRSVLDKIGLLDEDFFMYGEDIDLSYRILKAGYQNWYLPETILHYKGESTQKSSFRYVHVFYDAMLIFFKKHYSHVSFLISLPIKTAIYVKATVELVRMQLEKMRKSLGFVSSRRHKDPLYIFIGSERCIQMCRRLSRNTGLDAQFYIGNQETMPDGHISILNELENWPTHVYVVYDIDAFSFEHILSLFAKAPRNNILIGTFNTRTHTLITSEEILQ